jgi:ribosomal protein L37E
MSADVAVKLGDGASEVGQTADPGKPARASAEESLRRAAQALERIAAALERLAAERAQANWRTRAGVLAEALAEAARGRQHRTDRRWVDSCGDLGTFTLLGNGTAIRCNRCGRVSHDPIDVRDRYCAWCHTFLRREQERAGQSRGRGEEER